MNEQHNKTILAKYYSFKNQGQFSNPRSTPIRKYTRLINAIYDSNKLITPWWHHDPVSGKYLLVKITCEDGLQIESRPLLLSSGGHTVELFDVRVVHFLNGSDCSFQISSNTRRCHRLRQNHGSFRNLWTDISTNQNPASNKQERTQIAKQNVRGLEGIFLRD